MKVVYGRVLFGCLLLLFAGITASAQETAFPLKARKLLFLGDSITHAGEYVVWIELQMRLQGLNPRPEFINAGLSSETCSGLSEPDHPFPRPDVHERLDRALRLVQPDVVVACYGMNDGIYHPFSSERFEKYQQGINELVKKVHAVGAKIVLLTPPPFDAEPLKKSGKLLPAGRDKYAYFAVYELYDDVIREYGKWLLLQTHGADLVVDLHHPVTAYVAEKRKSDPAFTLAPDGVHPTSEGQRVIAETLLRAWGVESWKQPNPVLQMKMMERGCILHDAWLSHVGHKRPGTPAGLPLAEAQQKAAEIEREIEPLL